MPSSRYVAIGLARARAGWFRDVGRWATTASIPVEFIRCVSTEEIRARLAGGRSVSAVILDAATPGIDRDLIDDAIGTGAAVLIVEDGRSSRDWRSLGATATLPPSFDRDELVELLARHCVALGPVDTAAASVASLAPAGPWSGQLVAVTGRSGAGASTLAMALARGVADDPRYRGHTLLADFELDADQAMFHDAGDVLPGVQELVDAHRTGTPDVSEVRSLTYATADHGYHVLLGLRRHRDWVTVRPRSFRAALENLCRSYRVVIGDVDADLEGADAVGSIDVEERNTLARTTVARADLVVAVGSPGLKGLRALVRVIDDLVDFGVASDRMLPVINRSSRATRQRAELTRAFGELVADVAGAMASPIHVPDRRGLDQIVADNAPLPRPLTRTLSAAVLSMLGELPARHRPHVPDHTPVAPGSLGRLHDDGPAPESEPT